MGALVIAQTRRSINVLAANRLCLWCKGRTQKSDAFKLTGLVTTLSMYTGRSSRARAPSHSKRTRGETSAAERG